MSQLKCRSPPKTHYMPLVFCQQRGKPHGMYLQRASVVIFHLPTASTWTLVSCCPGPSVSRPCRWPRVSGSTTSSQASHWSHLRAYATHQDKGYTPENASPHSRIRTGPSTLDGRETVGPFPLGVGPNAGNKIWKPWKDLNISGKRELTVTAQNAS